MSATTSPADDVPPTVQRTLRFFREQGIWHRTSQNPPVRSCVEAAAQRRRMGTVGIPVCDELKSLLYAYRLEDGVRRFALLHCGGHQRVDLAKVAAVLQADAEPVPGRELAATFGACYGAVTPVLFTDHPDVANIVDTTVVERSHPPFTMMTNSGHLEYAVEFHPRELFAALPRTSVHDIVIGGRRPGGCSL